jgi:tetratricopeptide (TPR) repeat protein
MYRKRTTVLPLLAGAFFLLTGFSWNFGGDKCKDALELANKLPVISDDATRTSDEARILASCPDGAAAQFVQGLQAERVGNSDGAIAAYRRALQKEPGFAAASGNLGLLYLQKGLQDDAAVALTKGLSGQSVPAYHKALAKIMMDKKFYVLALYHYGEAGSKQPSDAGVLAGQAEVYAAQGQTDRAIDEFRRALLLDPSHEQATLSLAGIYLQQNQQDAALDLLKKASTANPRSSRLHLMLADIYDKKGDAKQAEYERLLGGKKGTAVVEEQPAKPEGLALGDQLAAKGEVDKAAEAYRAVLKQQPDSVEPLEKLGALYFRAGRDGDALLAYRDATHLGSANPEVYYNLGLLYEKRNQLDEAVVAYKRAIEKKPTFAEARLKLADIRLGRGNTQEAVEQYVEFLKLKPESADIHLKLARIFVKNKNLSLAEESYKAVLKLAPDNVEANREVAAVYRATGATDKAVEHYTKALELQKDDSESRNALVAIYVKDKKYDKLAELLQQAVALAPDDANNHYKLGLIYDFKKEYDNAIASYKKAIELKPDHARALHALGRVYMKIGRLSEAREALEAAKKADPSMEETSILLNNIRDEFNPVPRKAGKSKKGSRSKSKSKKSKKSTKSSAKSSKAKTPAKKTSH